MLYDDVSHVVPAGVTILVEAVHRTEDELVTRDGPILTPYSLCNKQSVTIETINCNHGDCTEDVLVHTNALDRLGSSYTNTPTCSVQSRP